MELTSILVMLAAFQTQDRQVEDLPVRSSGTESLFPASPQPALQLLGQSLCIGRVRRIIDPGSFAILLLLSQGQVCTVLYLLYFTLPYCTVHYPSPSPLVL
jgi:hypothetical protein